MRRVGGRTDRVVVVGAGLGGLSAALRLAAAGREVTVVEREDVPGGRAGVLDVDGYRFDTGPSVLTMPDLIRDAFGCVGEDMDDWLRLRPVDPVYRAFFPDGSTLDVRSDPDAMAAEVERTCGPAEAAGYRRYVTFVETLYRLERNDFIDRNHDSPLGLLTPSLARLAALGAFRRLAPKVGQYLKDPRTQRVMSFQSMYAGLSPYDALAVYAVIAYMDSVSGVYFPEGGMHAVPRALAGAAEKHGVTFRYATTVTSVTTRDGRATGVQTEDGHIAADVVVLNPDLPVAYRELLPPEATPRRVRSQRYSPSCFLLLAGSTRRYERIAHHNLHFGKAWRTTFDELVDRRTLMSDPSVLVTSPTVSDASLAPPGRHSYYVLVPTTNLDGRVEWNATRNRYREEDVGHLERLGYSGFGDAVEVERVTTPYDWRARGMERGTPFAAAHTFAQTGPFRPKNLAPRIDGVVFTGSGTVPGVGVPMVLLSGRLAAERIVGRQ
jgi:phytoene desaturase